MIVLSFFVSLFFVLSAHGMQKPRPYLTFDYTNQIVTYNNHQTNERNIHLEELKDLKDILEKETHPYHLLQRGQKDSEKLLSYILSTTNSESIHILELFLKDGFKPTDQHITMLVKHGKLSKLMMLERKKITLPDNLLLLPVLYNTKDSNSIAVFLYLLSKEHFYKKKDEYGNTPLHVFAGRHKYVLTLYLRNTLQKKYGLTYIQSKNSDNQAPLECAIKNLKTDLPFAHEAWQTIYSLWQNSAIRVEDYYLNHLVDNIIGGFSDLVNDNVWFDYQLRANKDIFDYIKRVAEQLFRIQNVYFYYRAKKDHGLDPMIQFIDITPLEREILFAHNIDYSTLLPESYEFEDTQIKTLINVKLNKQYLKNIMNWISLLKPYSHYHLDPISLPKFVLLNGSKAKTVPRLNKHVTDKWNRRLKTYEEMDAGGGLLNIRKLEEIILQQYAEKPDKGYCSIM